jgi:hypothetical protein
MKLTTLTTATAALAITLAFAQSAQAREHHYRYSGYYRHAVSHAAGRYAFAHHYAPAAEQTDNWGWGEQNEQRDCPEFGGHDRAECKFVLIVIRIVESRKPDGGSS